jgi:hypothetical protein
VERKKKQKNKTRTSHIKNGLGLWMPQGHSRERGLYSLSAR